MNSRHVVLLGAVFSLSTHVGIADARQADSQPALTRASATLRIVPGQRMVMVRLTNLGSVTLDAWELRITFDLASGERQSVEVATDTYLTDREAPFLGQGPVAPGKTKEMAVVLPAQASNAFVEILMLSFEDRSVDGSRERRDAVLARRDRTARNLEFWLQTLRSAAEQNPRQAKATLIGALNSPEGTPDPTDPTSVVLRNDVAKLAADDGSEFAARLTALIQRFQRNLNAATTHRPRLAEAQEGQAGASGSAQPGEHARVLVKGRTGELQGVLVDGCCAAVVKLQVDGKPVELRLDQIARIDLERRDSVLEGAIIGALSLGLGCGLYWCGEAPSRAGAALGAAAIGGIIGAAIDKALTSRTTIHVAPATREGWAVSVRVAF
jgi:hypothetical protein